MNGYNRGFPGGRGRKMPAQPSSETAKQAAGALNASPEEVRKAAQSGDIQALTSRLTPQQAEQIRKLLADEAATKRLLATPQAQALLKSLRKDE